MINGAVHTLSSSLAESLQNYRSHITARQETQDVQQPEQPETPGPDSSNTADSTQSELEDSKEISQERRDTARKTAVHAFKLKNAQTSMETLIHSTENKSDENMSTSSIDPTEAYLDSLKYSRRTSLINAFENAAQGEIGGDKINIVI